MNNVIDFEKERLRRMKVDDDAVVDTHEAVLDVSDVVLTTNDLVSTVDITEDTIVIRAEEEKDG